MSNKAVSIIQTSMDRYPLLVKREAVCPMKGSSLREKWEVCNTLYVLHSLLILSSRGSSRASKLAEEVEENNHANVHDGHD